MHKFLIALFVINLAVIALSSGYLLHYRVSNDKAPTAARFIIIFCCLCSIGQVAIGMPYEVNLIRILFTGSIAVLTMHDAFVVHREIIEKAKDNERTRFSKKLA